MKHSEIIELLPWYANATLAEDERRVVESHLAECPECAREVAGLAKLQKSIIEIGNQTPASSSMALNRAMAEIENYERSRVQPAPARGIWERLSSSLGGWWKPTPMLARAVIAVQLAVVLGFAAVIFYQHSQINQNDVYTTSSGPSGDKNNTRIAVGFNQAATEQEIRQAVLAVHGKIIDGPSALGLYTLQVPVAPDRAGEVENVLKTLRENQHTIRFAEQKQ
jgi:hypothetical protein